ncbi:MAG: putative bifunctional diguanylate cyclase/phosphodiesterase [Beijerinckiaceae bacterium]
MRENPSPDPGRVVTQPSRGLVARLKNVLQVNEDDQQLIMSQFGAYVELMPLLYFILLTNFSITAWNFYGTAPDAATVYFPAAVSLLCLARSIFWIRLRNVDVSFQEANSLVRNTSKFSMALAVVLTFWSGLLFSYGSPVQQGHVAFFTSTTMIGCILCQISVRAAALRVLLIVNIPFSTLLIMSGSTVFISIGVNLLLVSVGLWLVVLKYSAYFKDIVHARAQMREKNAELNRINEEAERLLRENRMIANIDSLTGLPNRRQFFLTLNDQFAYAKQTGTRLAVGVIDLDGFKAINDLYGHANGDELLRHAADRLNALKTNNVTFARMGGDEFAFIVNAWQIDAELMALSRRICDTLRVQFDMKDCTARVSGSVGLAVYPDTSGTPTQLYEKADYALYHAKRMQRGNVIVFSETHEAEIRRKRSVEQALQRADFDTDLTVVFQPIIDAKTHRVASFEALARWDHAELGSISPAEFIQTAEHLGLIGQITRSLLTRTLEVAKKWPDNYRIAFNLSPLDVTSPEAAIRIVAIANASGINPKRVRFEITETAIVSHMDNAKAAIALFKQFGARVAIDDFGTGYSSLSQLHRLPWDYIKIDKSFITDILSNEISEKLIKSIVSMTRELNLRCVAEGIENAEQMHKVTELGIDFLQGYHISRPLTSAQADRLIAWEQENIGRSSADQAIPA